MHNGERADGACRPLGALLGAAMIGAGLARWSLSGVILGGAGACLLAATMGPAPGRRRPAPLDRVDEASADSFPASDPPAFTATRPGD